jgi:hypothetical protein
MLRISLDVEVLAKPREDENSKREENRVAKGAAPGPSHDGYFREIQSLCKKDFISVSTLPQKERANQSRPYV